MAAAEATPRRLLGGQLAERYQPVAYPDRPHDRCAGRQRPGPRARRLVDLRGGDRGRRGLDPGPVSARGRAPARQRRLARRPGRRGDGARRGARRGAPAGRGTRGCATMRRAPRWPPPPRRWACRTPPRRIAAELLAMGEGRPLPSLAGTAPPDGRGAERGSRPGPARRAGRRARHRAAARMRRWRRSPRCGSAARPTGWPRRATATSLLAALRIARQAEVPGVRPRATAATWWWPMPASAGWSSATAPGTPPMVDGQLIAEAGSADGHARQALHRRGAGRPGVRHQHSRHAGRRGVGQRRRAWRRDARRDRVGRRLGTGERHGRRAWRRRLRLRLSRVALQARRRGGAGGGHPPAARRRRRHRGGGGCAPGQARRRPSHWPTRTPAASSATRRATTPDA